jgi:GPH family glycoside/pentoside/hexuronide:cation symporter
VLGEALPVQPDRAISAIRVFAGPVPAVLLGLSILFAWLYPITRESHQKNLDELDVQVQLPSDTL